MRCPKCGSIFIQRSSVGEHYRCLERNCNRTFSYAEIIDKNDRNIYCDSTEGGE